MNKKKQNLKANQEVIDGESNLFGEKTDKVEEYFKIKDEIRTFNSDFKDQKIALEQTEQIENLMKKVRDLREEISQNESIRIIKDKLLTLKERKALLLELIRIELLENGQDEIKRRGKKLKLVNIMKELKDEGDKNKPRQIFRN